MIGRIIDGVVVLMDGIIVDGVGGEIVDRYIDGMGPSVGVLGIVDGWAIVSC